MSSSLESEFPANRKTQTERVEPPKEKPKAEKVIEGTVIKRKKGIGSKIAESFSGDDAQTVGNYILLDVVVPATKTMIADAVSQGIERMLFGEVRSRRNGGPRVGPGSHISYNRIGNNSSLPTPPTRTMSRQARATHNFDEVILETRGEAEKVLEMLTETISLYDVATVSDLYDLIGLTGNFTDEKWGWTDLRDASITRVRNGYLLDLPRTSPLD